MKEFKRCSINSLLVVEKNGNDDSVGIIKNFGKKIISALEEQDIKDYPLEDGKELLTGIRVFENEIVSLGKTCYLISSKIRDASFSDLQDNYGNYNEEQLKKIRNILLAVYESEIVNNQNNEKEIKEIAGKEQVGKILYGNLIKMRNM